MPLKPETVDLLKTKAVCYIATVMADGSPQVTLTWVDTDGEHVLVNTVVGNLKWRNIQRDPRVAVALASPDEPSAFTQVRGTVVEQIRGPEAVDHIEALSQRYTGGPYQWYACRDQERVILVIEPNG